MKVVILGKGLMLANIILGAMDAGAEIVGVFDTKARVILVFVWCLKIF